MIRLANETDVRRMSVTCARAFDDDPVWRWFIPSDGYFDRWMIFVGGMFRHITLGNRATYTTDDGVSVAAWSPPGGWETSEAQAEALMPAFQTCFGANLDKFQHGFGFVESKHPHKPHWYLAGLATHPDWQGQGIASAVMRPILERCDAEGLPAYLEATKEKNVGFYRQHGFEVTDRLELPNGGPMMILMWREPQRIP